MTIRGSLRPKLIVRYWVDGEDEDYERELERVRRFGGVPPQPMSASVMVGIVVLGGVQVLVLASMVFALLAR
jgi:hypothetical protein